MKRHPYADTPQFQQANPEPWTIDRTPVNIDPHKPPTLNWVVYFIQEGEDGNIKIGRTQGNPLDRMANFQVGNSSKLFLRNTVRCDYGFENRLHERFKDCHVYGEWHRPVPELVEFMRNPVYSYPTLERHGRCECGTDMGVGGQTKCWNCDPDQWEAVAA